MGNASHWDKVCVHTQYSEPLEHKIFFKIFLKPIIFLCLLSVNNSFCSIAFRGRNIHVDYIVFFSELLGQMDLLLYFLHRSIAHSDSAATRESTGSYVKAASVKDDQMFFVVLIITLSLPFSQRTTKAKCFLAVYICWKLATPFFTISSPSTITISVWY